MSLSDIIGLKGTTSKCLSIIVRNGDFALYEAYGTRPYEWGSDPDRQKANTKEEEADLNLLNGSKGSGRRQKGRCGELTSVME